MLLLRRGLKKAFGFGKVLGEAIDAQQVALSNLTQFSLTV